MSDNTISMESKALSILETYNGANNYILELKRKSEINRKFYLTQDHPNIVKMYEMFE